MAKEKAQELMGKLSNVNAADHSKIAKEYKADALDMIKELYDIMINKDTKADDFQTAYLAARQLQALLEEKVKSPSLILPLNKLVTAIKENEDIAKDRGVIGKLRALRMREIVSDFISRVPTFEGNIASNLGIQPQRMDTSKLPSVDDLIKKMLSDPEKQKNIRDLLAANNINPNDLPDVPENLRNRATDRLSQNQKYASQDSNSGVYRGADPANRYSNGSMDPSGGEAGQNVATPREGVVGRYKSDNQYGVLPLSKSPTSQYDALQLVDRDALAAAEARALPNPPSSGNSASNVAPEVPKEAVANAKAALAAAVNKSESAVKTAAAKRAEAAAAEIAQGATDGKSVVQRRIGEEQTQTLNWQSNPVYEGTADKAAARAKAKQEEEQARIDGFKIAEIKNVEAPQRQKAVVAQPQKFEVTQVGMAQQIPTAELVAQPQKAVITNPAAADTQTKLRYPLKLTDELNQFENNKTGEITRVILSSILANIGMPTDEITSLLDSATPDLKANVDNQHIFRLVRMAEDVVKQTIILKDGAKLTEEQKADLYTNINSKIQDKANNILRKVGLKAIANEDFIAENYYDINAIRADGLERGNKMLERGLDTPVAWKDFLVSAINDDRDYANEILKKHATQGLDKPDEYSFSGRMKFFGGVGTVGALSFGLAQLFFPPLAFIGSLLLVFAFVGAVLTVVAEVVKIVIKLVEQVMKLCLGLMKLGMGLLTGITDVLKAPVIALMNRNRDKENQIDYFALTKNTMKGMDIVTREILGSPKEPSRVYKTKDEEKFLKDRSSLTGKLEEKSGGKVLVQNNQKAIEAAKQQQQQLIAQQNNQRTIEAARQQAITTKIEPQQLQIIDALKAQNAVIGQLPPIPTRAPAVGSQDDIALRAGGGEQQRREQLTDTPQSARPATAMDLARANPEIAAATRQRQAEAEAARAATAKPTTPPPGTSFTLPPVVPAAKSPEAPKPLTKEQRDNWEKTRDVHAQKAQQAKVNLTALNQDIQKFHDAVNAAGTLYSGNPEVKEKVLLKIGQDHNIGELSKRQAELNKQVEEGEKMVKKAEQKLAEDRRLVEDIAAKAPKSPSEMSLREHHAIILGALSSSTSPAGATGRSAHTDRLSTRSSDGSGGVGSP